MSVTMTALPPPPSRSDDEDVFAAKGDALLGALPQFVTEANALSVAATNDSTIATTQANIAVGASNTAQASASTVGAVLWVSGTSYTAGTSLVYSPLTYKTYRRKVTGAGTTDPSLDPTNWQAVVEVTNPTVSKSANYTVTVADKASIISGTSTFTLTYPTAASVGGGWSNFVTNDGTGYITITPTTSTINGLSTVVLPPYAMCWIESDGSNYRLFSFQSQSANRIGNSVASAANINLDTTTGDIVHVTGSVNITSITLQAGYSKTLVFDASSTITHSSSLVLPGAVNMTTYTGLVLRVIGEAGLVRIAGSNKTQQYFKISDQKSTGSGAGTSAAGDITQTRSFNTTDFNDITGASVSTNAITLPAGTYSYRVRAPAFGTSLSHKAFLYNSTDSTYIGVGSNGSVSGQVTDSLITGRFTINSVKILNVRHYTSQATSSSGLGLAVNVPGFNEVYTEAEFWKES